jgi:hypothetical protein
MGGYSGINLSGIPGELFSIASGIRVITNQNSLYQEITPGIQGPWTPPQFSKPALTILTVPATTSSTSGQSATAAIYYVFDAVFKLTHHRTLRKTQHPVLTGANISDHAYLEPSKVVMEIGMSDCMASFSNGVWVGSSTKSISAWQILKQLQISKTLLTLISRLDTYNNLLIQDLVANDDNKTKYALKATVALEEVLSASVTSVEASSARPQTTNSTMSGFVQSVNPSTQQIQQNVNPSLLWPNVPMYPNVLGAGSVGSTSLGQVP